MATATAGACAGTTAGAAAGAGAAGLAATADGAATGAETGAAAAGAEATGAGAAGLAATAGGAATGAAGAGGAATTTGAGSGAGGAAAGTGAGGFAATTGGAATGCAGAAGPVGAPGLPDASPGRAVRIPLPVWLGNPTPGMTRTLVFGADGVSGAGVAEATPDGVDAGWIGLASGLGATGWTEARDTSFSRGGEASRVTGRGAGFGGRATFCGGGVPGVARPDPEKLGGLQAGAAWPGAGRAPCGSADGMRAPCGSPPEDLTPGTGEGETLTPGTVEGTGAALRGIGRTMGPDWAHATLARPTIVAAVTSTRTRMAESSQ